MPVQMPSLKKYVRVHDILGVGQYAGREELLAAVSRHFNLEVLPSSLPLSPYLSCPHKILYPPITGIILEKERHSVSCHAFAYRVRHDPTRLGSL